MMEMEQRWGEVPVGESWRDRTLAVVHRGKSVGTVVEWQVDVFLDRHRNAKRAWLLAGDGSITRGFGRGGQDHQGWGGQRIGQVGGALHFEGCPVEVHVWTEVGGGKNFKIRKGRRLFLLSELRDNVQDPWGRV